LWLRWLLPAFCLLVAFDTHAEESPEAAAENASNPLAKTRNTDFIGAGFRASGDVDLATASVEGAFMARSNLKVKYEAHYWRLDAGDRKENGLESVTLKGIWFPKEGRRGNWGYRLALGLDWVLDGGNSDDGIGSGSDLLAPFAGVALSPRQGTTIIPLVQHFEEYKGNPFSMTAVRVIAMQALPERWWLKLDGIVPFDWENDRAVPATLELQLGKSVSRAVSLFGNAYAGLGSDRPYDYGFGFGIRLSY
jgi:hypothetical protein